MSLSRRVLVTGASKGIGQAIAYQLGLDGFDVVVHYYSDQEGAMLTQQSIIDHGGHASVIQFDIGNTEQCREVIENDIEKYGPYYGVVNNAGIAKDAAFPALTNNEWHSVIHTNLDSFYNVLQPCIMPMIGLRQGGRIVTISSVSGLAGNRGQVNYSAAKAGVIGATKALALELAKRKITVNCVAPGLIETDMLSMDATVMDEALKMVPLKRVGQKDEVAALVSFLISDRAAYITRQVISINGGML